MLDYEEIKRCRKYLEPVFERYDTYNWQDVVENIEKGRWFLLAYPTSALLIEIIQYPRKKTLYIPAVGGNLDEVTSAQEQLETIAKKQGCKDIEFRGRKGWEKVAKKFKGYKTHYVVINKELV
jgi:hypothetical protein